MHKVKLTHMSELYIEKWLEDFRDGLKMKLRINGYSVLEIIGEKIINDGVEASTRKSQACFQII